MRCLNGGGAQSNVQGEEGDSPHSLLIEAS